jgi:hypothetical protein
MKKRSYDKKEDKNQENAEKRAKMEKFRNSIVATMTPIVATMGLLSAQGS